MKNWYYSDGLEKHGPFSLEELKNHPIDEETHVWVDGMDDWKPAGEVSAISMLFDLGAPPPAIVKEESNSASMITDHDMEDERPMPKTYLVEAILVTCFCCLPFGIVALVNAAKVESTYRTLGYEEAKIASDNALKWTKWSLWSVVIGLGLYFIFFMFLLVFSLGIS